MLRAVVLTVQRLQIGTLLAIWKRSLSIAITFVTGVIFTVQYDVPHPASETLLSEASVRIQIISGFAIISAWGASYTRIISRSNGKRRAGATVSSCSFPCLLCSAPAFGRVERPKILCSAGSITMSWWRCKERFSFLAFSVASAAYRAFRARTPEANVSCFRYSGDGWARPAW